MARPNPILLTSVVVMAYGIGAMPGSMHCLGVVEARAAVVAASPSATEETQAVLKARQGDTGTALSVLDRLRREHPEDIRVARDIVVVNAWAGDDSETIRLFTALPPGQQPDYVIEAVALSYRHLGRPAEALVLYRHGLLRSPGNVLFAAGEIRSLVDLDQATSAIARAEADLSAHGDRVDILLAAGFAEMAQKNPVEALRYIDRAVKLAPDSRETVHDRLMAIDAMGAPQIARQLADQNRSVLSSEELRHIDGDVAAALVRSGPFEPPSEAQRFAASDRAIAALDRLIQQWSQDGDAARGDILRARFDRMVAYRDRVRMSDVVAEYEALGRQGVAIPSYAVTAAADAYLYRHQPELARDLYLRSLAVDPRNPDTRLALFYAYVDLNDFNHAY